MTFGIIADIGGTNARFALCTGVGQYGPAVRVKCADFPGLSAAASHCIDKLAPPTVLRAGAFCVAAPLAGDQVTMTNHPWQFSVDQIQKDLALTRLTVVNDFAAIALAVPHLGPNDRVKIGGGDAVAGAPVAVLGAGTGLGVSGLVFPPGGTPLPLSTEGGHVSLAAQDDKEEAIIRILRSRFGHVSAERVASGPGLVNLYQALCTLEGVAPEPLTPADITGRAQAEDRLCQQAFAHFCRFLCAAAGDMAMTIGARGGVVIAGGIAPQMPDHFAASDFRKSFEAKGRYKSFLAIIPTHLITHKHPALVGLSTLVEV